MAQEPVVSPSRDRIIRGGTALTIRQILSLPLNAAGLAAASLWLVPVDFGVLAILTIVTNGAFTVVDLGFTNALIQSGTTPSRRTLRQVQWYKLGSGFVSIVILTIAIQLIASYYALPSVLPILIPACGLIAWLQSERGHQSIWLQRTVDWERLAKVEIAEVFVYNICLVMSAWLLRSPSCFLIGLATRYAVGGVMLKAIPVRTADATSGVMPIRGGPTDSTLRDLLRFGLPYQATTVLSMVQKSLNPMIVGSFAGVEAVGLVNWGGYVASLPLAPMQPMYALLFSVMAERNRTRRESGDILRSVVRVGTVAGTFLSVLVALLLPVLARHALQPQWERAVPVATVLLFANSTAVASGILTTYLTARGHSTAWMKTVILETVLIWLLGVGGLWTGGVIGFTVGLLVAGAVVLAVQRKVMFHLFGNELRIREVFGPALMAVVSGTVAFATTWSVPVPGLAGELLPAFLGCSTFIALAWTGVVPGLRQDAVALISGAREYFQQRQAS